MKNQLRPLQTLLNHAFTCAVLVVCSAQAAEETKMWTPAEFTPHFPAIGSDPMALSGAARRKQIPSSLPQGLGHGKTVMKPGSEKQFHESETFTSAPETIDFYGLKSDPLERRSLAGEKPDEVRRLSELWADNWRVRK